MTLLIFRTERNCPVKKDISEISFNSSKMSFFRSFKVFTGLLFGPDNLWESNDDIIKEISFLSVGVKKNVFVFVLVVFCIINPFNFVQ